MKRHLLKPLVAAALLAGTAGLALAQQATTPNDTTAQARPADQPAAPAVGMRPAPPPPGAGVRPAAPVPPSPTVMPQARPAGPNPAVTPPVAPIPPNDTTAQSHAGEKMGGPAKHHPRMHPHPRQDPNAPAPVPRVNTGPDSGAPYTPATATDNTTDPKPAAPR